MRTRKVRGWELSLGWDRSDEAWRLGMARKGRGAGRMFVLFEDREKAEEWFAGIGGNDDVERLLDQVEIRPDES